MPGVLQTKIGFLGGAEIVEVTYDPKRVKVAAMVRALKQKRSFTALHTNKAALRKQAKGYLAGRELRSQRGNLRFIRAKHTLRTRHRDLYYLPLTEKQAMALNTWSYFGGTFPKVLTPALHKLRLALQKKLKGQRRVALRPVRTGKGLAQYRKQFARWLKQ